MVVQEELSNRADAADARYRRRRRVSWLVAAAAVVVVGGTGAVVASSRAGGETQVPVVVPSGSVSGSPLPRAEVFSSTDFRNSFTVVLPEYAVDRFRERDESVAVGWRSTSCAPSYSDCLYVGFHVFTMVPPRPGEPAKTPMPGYEGYVAHLADMETAGELALDFVSTTTIGGRPATVFQGTVGEGISLGCWRPGTGPQPGPGVDAEEGPTGPCLEATIPDGQVRVAVVDVGRTPVVTAGWANPGAPRSQAWMSQIDQMLTTVEWT
jgi:hypothetical protein